MKRLLTNSIGYLDFIAWSLVICFFVGNSLLFGGDILLALIGAGGIIVEMALIAAAVEIIIESLRYTKGIGTLTGFITNGPEAVCLVVGLLVGDIIFATSTPLGSNFMNPLLLVVAALICRQTKKIFAINRLYTAATILCTFTFAGSFFLLHPHQYIFWLLACLVVTISLFIIRPKEQENNEEADYSFKPQRWLGLSIIGLTVSGYYLDPVVSFAATHSHAPKGLIGFVVLASLTSWPEFKSCLALLKRGKSLAAILNITVSNITNIWLTAIGVTTYLFIN